MISPASCLRFVFDAAEEHFAGLVGGHIGDLQQALALVFEDGVELLFLGGHLFVAGD